MEVEGISTGSVRVTERQRRGAGPEPLRRLRTMTDRRFTGPLPVLAWLVRHPEGPIVVDTGETARACQPGWFPRWHPYFRLAVRLDVDEGEEIGPQLRARGIEPDAVATVVMTHLHTDHAGGLDHFPRSRVLVSQPELEDASGRAGKLRGYLPHRWPRWLRPEPIRFEAEPFGPFPESLPLTSDGRVRALPTPGHTRGHVSVAVDEGDRVLLLAGDASYGERPMVEGAVDGVAPDAGVARETLARIRALCAERPTVYLPSHDPEALERLAARRPAAAA